MKITFCLIVMAVFCGCGRQQQLKARIFERTELDNDRIMIKYNYRLGDKVYFDSATIANTIIHTDSIVVIIDPGNPGKSIPEIKL